LIHENIALLSMASYESLALLLTLGINSAFLSNQLPNMHVMKQKKWYLNDFWHKTIWEV
jgi:hypothetical protein